jgi:hypothetical protein
VVVVKVAVVVVGEVMGQVVGEVVPPQPLSGTLCMHAITPHDRAGGPRRCR